MAREVGQRPLEFGCKQAFALEFGLEAQEAFEQVALASPANGFDVELEFAARLVKRNQGARFDLLAIFQPPAEQLGPASPHDAAHLRASILQREIDMARRRVGQVGDFAPDPGQREGRLKTFAYQTIQAGDREDRVIDKEGGADHDRIVTPLALLCSGVDRV